MSLVLRESRTGLVVAEHSADEQSIQHALARMDDRLVLVRDRSDTYQRDVWKVVYRVSDWQDAVTICVWADDHGQPLPLSSGILDETQKLRPENRGKRVDVDAHNEQLVAERRRDFNQDIDYLEGHYRKLVKNGPDPHDSEGMVLHPRRFGIDKPQAV